MAAVEINITLGTLRQPGMWGKILIPWNGSIYELNEERGYELSAKGQTRTIKWEDVADAAYIILGLRGYHGAGGNMVHIYVLLKAQSGFHFDKQLPGHLTHFECKGVRLMEMSETDLQPLYDSLKMFKYEHLDRLQEFLRKEGIDKSVGSPAAPAAAAPPSPAAAPAMPAAAATSKQGVPAPAAPVPAAPSKQGVAPSPPAAVRPVVPAAAPAPAAARPASPAPAARPAGPTPPPPGPGGAQPRK